VTGAPPPPRPLRRWRAGAAGTPTPHRSGLEPAYGPVWWVGLAVGGAALAHGALGLVRDAMATVPPAWATWLLGVLVVHDLVLVPVVFAVAHALRRAPAAVRPEARAALVVSGVCVLVTLPALVGGGRATQPGNTSVLPSDYAANLALLLGLIWTVAAALALTRALRGRRRRGDRPAGRSPRRVRG